MDIGAMVVEEAQRQGVDARLALEVAIQESGLNQSAVSPAGAIGVMQLEPATAASLGVDPTDEAENISGGVRYLAQLLGQFPVDAAIAAYNWGPGRVNNAIAKYGGAWLEHAPAETQNYVVTILGNLGTQYDVSPTPPAASPDASAAVEAGVVSTGMSFRAILLLAALGLVVVYVFSEAAGSGA